MTTSSSTTASPLRVLFDRFEIDEAEARLSEGGQPVHLAPKPFALLCALARTPHTLITNSRCPVATAAPSRPWRQRPLRR